ncbi:MAG: electron transfer flavoprotein subunit beta/FixA family protein [Candidatus Binatia bacterium]
MKIVICAKEVRDPDAVDTYALHGKLEIGADGKTLTQTAIPRLMNAYDEQAIEAALRLRDGGCECTIHVVSIGTDPANILRHAAALGADAIAHIPVDIETIDGPAAAALLAAYVRSIGGAELVLCGRQASDDDQGVVPALVGELLHIPIITVARAVELSGSTVRVTRVTPNGDEVVEAACPAVVTISNELGTPRYPTTARTMKARRMKPTVLSLDQLSLQPSDIQPRVTLTRQFVSTTQGNCEFVTGSSPAELAERLVRHLRQAQVIA